MTDHDIDMTPEPTILMMVGDTHHDTAWTLDLIDYACNLGVDTFLQVGDLGWWPTRFGGEEGFVSAIEPVLAERGKRWYWIDGNHEDHDTIVPGMSQGVVQHLPRGFRWQWWGKDWMAVGGGASVDKHRRTPGFDWFPQEVLSTREAEYCVREGNVDIIVSHDCPDDVMELDFRLRPDAFPADQIVASEAHRRLLGAICDAVNPQLLVHGHYHIPYVGSRPRKSRPSTRVVGLGNNYDTFEDSTLVLTKDDVWPQERRP